MIEFEITDRQLIMAWEETCYIVKANSLTELREIISNAFDTDDMTKSHSSLLTQVAKYPIDYIMQQVIEVDHINPLERINKAPSITRTISVTGDEDDNFDELPIWDNEPKEYKRERTLNEVLKKKINK